MHSLIICALGLSRTRSPAVKMLADQLYKVTKGDSVTHFADAKERTLSMTGISQQDKEILMDKKFLKRIPKDFNEKTESEFCRIVCNIEVRDKKQKSMMHIENRTVVVLYFNLQREVLKSLRVIPDVYQRFMLKATKKRISGWQELSQKIGNFNSFINNRLYSIDGEIKDLLSQEPSSSELRNLAGPRIQKKDTPVEKKEKALEKEKETPPAPVKPVEPEFDFVPVDEEPSEDTRESPDPVPVYEPTHPDPVNRGEPSPVPSEVQQGPAQPNRDVNAPETAPMPHQGQQPDGRVSPETMKTFRHALHLRDQNAIAQILTLFGAGSLPHLDVTCIDVLETFGVPRRVKLDDRMVKTPELETVLDNVRFVQEESQKRYGDTEGNPEVYLRLGNAGILTGSTELAMELYNRALYIFTATGNEVGRSLALNRISYLFIMTGEYDQGNENLKQALEIGERYGDVDTQVESLENMGHIHRLRGEYQTALELYHRAKTASERTQDRKKHADCLNNIGHMYDIMGNREKAVQTYQRVLHVYEILDEKKEITTTMAAIGGILVGQGEFEKSLKVYEDALRTAREIDYKHGIGVVLNNIGLVHKAKGDLDAARESFMEALRIGEKVGDKHNIASCHNNISTIFKEKKDYEKALLKAKEAMAIAEELGDKRNISTYLNNISMLYRMQGRDRKAMKCLEQALSISEDLGDKSGIAGRLNNIASIHYKKGDHAKAMEYLERALPLFEELGSPVAETVRENIATLKKKMED